MTKEIKIMVTVQLETDLKHSNSTLEQVAVEAITNALNLVEGAGFEHSLAYEASIGVSSVEVIKTRG